MSAGYGNTRCCVAYCDGVGADPIKLLANLHVLLCNRHGREWREQHSSAHVKTAETHRRWRVWLKTAGHAAWTLQSGERQALERALIEQRTRLRAAELARFRNDLETAERVANERTVTATNSASLASRAIRQVASALRRAVFAGESRPAVGLGRLAASVPQRRR